MAQTMKWKRNYFSVKCNRPWQFLWQLDSNLKTNGDLIKISRELTNILFNWDFVGFEAICLNIFKYSIAAKYRRTLQIEHKWMNDNWAQDVYRFTKIIC